MLHFVENVTDIIENIKTMESYLVSDIPEEVEFAHDLVKKGRSMVIYRVNGHNHLAPARFIGFKKNSKSAFTENENRETRDNGPILQTLLGKAFTHAAIEKEFDDYANTFKGHTLKSKRKYWRVRGEDNKYFELMTLAAEETAVA